VRPLLLWLRRGVVSLMVPATVAFLAVTAVGNSSWRLDADWGMRFTAGAIMALTPLLAALVAYDLAKRVHPTLAEIGRGSARGASAQLLPIVGGWLCAVLATLAVWITMAVVVQRGGGLPAADLWVHLEMMAAFAAAAAAGGLVGTLMPGLGAPAVAAGSVLTLGTFLGGQGVKVFHVASSSGTMMGIERTPLRAGLAVGVNVAVVLLCLGALLVKRGGRSRGRGKLAVLSVPLIASIMALFIVPMPDSEYRPSREDHVCVGSAPRVCGPDRAAPLLGRAQDDLARATRQLAGAGLALPGHFVVARGEAVRSLGPDRALLDYDPSALVDGHLTTQAVVGALSAPRVCEALFHDDTAADYLERIGVVARWLEAALGSASAVDGVAPADVREAYGVLSSCTTPVRVGS